MTTTTTFFDFTFDPVADVEFYAQHGIDSSKEFTPLEGSTKAALKVLLENAVKSIDTGVLEDMGDVGMLINAIKSVAISDPKIPDSADRWISGPVLEMEEAELFGTSEGAARTVLSSLLGARWKVQDQRLFSNSSHQAIRAQRRYDGSKLIAKVRTRSKNP